MGDALADGGTRVVDAVGDDGPAVVLALLDDVQLIATARSVFVVPELAGKGVCGKTFGVANAICPDFRQRAGFVEEGIVGGRRSVGGDVEDLAEVTAQVLCDRPGWGVGAVTRGDEQGAIGREDDAASGLASKPFRGDGGLCPEDDFGIANGELAFIESAAGNTGIGVGAIDVVEKGEKDAVVGGEFGIERYFENAEALRTR